MYGHDSKAIRSRYDYYYSVSSPSLSQATNYYENQASLFGERIPALLPPPVQRSPSPHHIVTPLTPFNNAHNGSSPSSAGGGVASANYGGALGKPPLIENFDNHLYESIRQNIMDQHNNNAELTNNLTKHQLWTQQSSSSTNTPPNDDDFDVRRKRASTAFKHYRSDDDVSHSKYRALSAHNKRR